MVIAYAGGGPSIRAAALSDAPAITASPVLSAELQWCAVCTTDGRYLTRGRAAVTDPAQPTRVCVTELTHPGALLDVYIGRGEQRFLLVLEDGLAFAAELCRTSWRGPRGRLCCFYLGSEMLL